LQRKILFLSLIAMAFFAMELTACLPGNDISQTDLATQQATGNEGSPSGAPQTSPEPEEIDPAFFQTQWEMSAHANTYVLDALGKNSTCARCHAPTSFVPSMEDMPESCAVCKFEVAPPPPTIAETDWGNVTCNICHRVKKDVVQPEYAWLSVPPIDEYEYVATTTELCMKCHGEMDIVGHGVPNLANAHQGYTCTECHDAHSTTATCASELCHASVANQATPTPGHDENHAAVTCWACHDMDGQTVGPDDQGKWVTFLPDSTIPFASHNIVKQASCDRCHFVNNPWNLSASVSQTNP